ncbi:gp363 [Bacillus phage G]|uniref:Gp363 n=1 Tax=Bacillus phage G TaxID=2884420 RepID=G3MAA4_9CAUD|nr:gp363 [Bacillus phage G]AEO93622.1 gp363 [Bacillus phage G]
MESTNNSGVLETKEIGLPISTSGTHFNTEIDEVTNTLRLKKVDTDATGTVLYASEGYWISNVIDLGDKFADFDKIFTTNVNAGSSSFSIFTRVSDNSITWSDWVAIAVDSTIQSETKQYIQIKINLFAGYTDSVFLISSFKNANDVNLFDNKNFIDTSNGLKLKRNYSFDMIKDETWKDTGSLHRMFITRSEWLKIDRLEVKNKPFIKANTDLVGILNADTSSNIKLYSSTVYGSQFENWKAFNGINDGGVNCTLLSGTSGYLAIVFNTKQPLGKYRIGYADIQTNNAVPTDWILYGSNDTTNGVDGAWTIIDTVSNQAWTAGQKGFRDFEIENKYGLVQYKAYRFSHSKNNGYSIYTAYSEIQLISPSYDVEKEVL